MRNLFGLIAIASMLLSSCAEDNLGRITKVVNDGVIYNGTSAEGFADIIDLSNDDHPDHGLCFGTVGTDSKPSIEDDTLSLGTVTERTPYSLLLRRFKYNTTYYFRPYVMDGNDAVYGDVLTARITSTENIVVLNQGLTATSYNSADFTARIEGLGSLMCIDFGVCYATEPNATIDNASVRLGVLHSDSTFTASVNGLDTYTTYYLRAFAMVDSNTVIYGEERTLNISEPQIQTLDVTVHTSTSVTLNGALVTTGINPVDNYGFCWGTNQNPTVSNNLVSFGNAAVVGNLSRYQGGLSSGISYHVRAFIITNGTAIYGEDIPFTIIAPTLTTGDVNTTSGTTATAVGELTIGNFSLLQRGHCWSTSPNPTIANSRTSFGATSQSGSLISNLTGLNGTFYIRAYAQDSTNVFYGEGVVVTQTFFSVQTLNTVSNSNDILVINGSLDVVGSPNITEYGHCWVAGSVLPTINDLRTDLGSSTTSVSNFQSTLSGLQGGQQYRIRAYATDGQTVAYGAPINYTNSNSVSFTNHSISVTATGQLTTNSQLIISGNVTVLQYGHCISTSQNPTIANTSTNLGTTNSSIGVASQFQDLPLVPHYFRAYAVTPNGTVYSSDLQVSFQGAWSQKADVTGARYGAIGFSANGKGYVALGQGTLNNREIKEYNPTTNSWVLKTNVPWGTPESASAAAVVSNEQYAYFIPAYTSDFYRYDPVANNWITLAWFPGSLRQGAVGFYLNGKIYIGAGQGDFGQEPFSDFWEYDIANNSWIQKANIPGPGRIRPVSFVIEAEGYVGSGRSNTTNSASWFSDYWKYIAQSDSWVQVASLSTPVDFAVSANGHAYVGTGSYSNLFRRFSPSTNTWVTVPNVPGGSRNYSFGFSINNRCYVGTGIPSPSGGTAMSDFWEHTIQQ